MLETNDLDPVYNVLWEAKLGPVELAHWLTAYWCFYHVGTASWIADGDDCPHFYERMRAAASSKDYPRSSERRHFRGENAKRSVEWILKTTVGDLWAEFDTAKEQGRTLTVEGVMKYVGGWVGFGPWISFKVADMLERLGIVNVRFDTGAMFLFDAPREGAAMMREEYGEGEADWPHEDRLGQWAVDSILGELGSFKAPPRYERSINVQEAETILCKWKSHRNGHYTIGKDTEEIRHGLLRFSRTKLCQRLFRAGRRSDLW